MTQLALPHPDLRGGWKDVQLCPCRAAGGTPVSGYCPHRTCPAPGCCCAAAATWTVLYGQPDQGSSPRTPARDRGRAGAVPRLLSGGHVYRKGVAEACRSLMWPGGTLLRDAGDVGVPPMQADQVHPVAPSQTACSTPSTAHFSVNSSHHQAVDCPAPGLRSLPSGRWTAFPRP